MLQYPGRGPRISEPHASSLPALAAEAAHDIARHTTGELVMAGHSMGGVLCYEIASKLTTMGRPPAWVVVSAARTPDRNRLDSARVLSMTREDWLAEIAGGPAAPASPTSPTETDEVTDLVIPVMRADYLMLARYQPAQVPLTVPLLALGGATDPWITDDHLTAWSTWTTTHFERRTLPGAHFYYRDQPAEFCAAIREGPRRSVSWV
ncbi:hypothetical protein GCM10009839_52450 [Catenulispora yoronensis]|uniref:Thioesterase domain-containing protein n=1 Tax=Catenulispora yoronensis TaxID=450799 RepID=A0ABN2USL4_9ACTN